MAARSTKRMDILRFLCAYHKQHGFAPAFREIAAAVGLNNTQSVNHHLGYLHRDGLIDRQPGARAILVTPAGKQAAGAALTAADKAAEREKSAMRLWRKLLRLLRQYRDLRERYDISLASCPEAKPFRQSLMAEMKTVRFELFCMVEEVDL